VHGKEEGWESRARVHFIAGCTFPMILLFQLFIIFQAFKRSEGFRAEERSSAWSPRPGRATKADAFRQGDPARQYGVIGGKVNPRLLVHTKSTSAGMGKGVGNDGHWTSGVFLGYDGQGACLIVVLVPP